MAEPPVVLVASGLDPSGGAGFILDQRVIAEAGAWGCGVVTALTVQDTSSARRCDPVDREILSEQLPALLSDFEIAAVKIGLVPSTAIADLVGRALEQTSAPVVWDPVFGASTGVAFLDDDPRAIAERLGPECVLVTPNLDEASLLCGRRIDSVERMTTAGAELAARWSTSVLVKGGHLDEDLAVDVLATAVGPSHTLSRPRVAAARVRGTGCFLSTSIAVQLATGVPLLSAIEASKAILTERLATPGSPGRGSDVLA